MVVINKNQYKKLKRKESIDDDVARKITLVFLIRPVYLMIK